MVVVVVGTYCKKHHTPKRREQSLLAHANTNKQIQEHMNNVVDM
jgi:hypothetical protein